jgi:hypothetical protein
MDTAGDVALHLGLHVDGHFERFRSSRLADDSETPCVDELKLWPNPLFRSSYCNLRSPISTAK